MTTNEDLERFAPIALDSRKYNARISDFALDEDGDVILSERGIERLEREEAMSLTPHEEEEMFIPFEVVGEIEIVVGSDDLLPPLETDAPEGKFA